MRKKNFQLKVDFTTIQSQWNSIQQLTGKEKYQALKSIGNLIAVAYKNGNYTVEQLADWMKILKVVSRSYDSPKNIRLHAKIISSWLTLTGNDNTEILLKKTKTISIDSGTIMVGDPSLACTLGDFSEKSLVSLLNQQQRFIFATHADGFYHIQLRIIRAQEPVLTPKEYKLVVSASFTSIIQVPSGIIRVADLGFVRENSLEQAIEPGNYKITAFKFVVPSRKQIEDRTSFESYNIVLCKVENTEIEAANFIADMQ